METVFLESSDRYGYDFIPGEYLPPGQDEYYIRDKQRVEFYARTDAFRHLAAEEIHELEAGGNSCADWDDLWVSAVFDPRLISGCFFAGRVRIGNLRHGLLRYHDYTVPVGVTGSRIISCDIGDNPAIHDCRYLLHYIIGDNVILSAINEMETTNHSKFGEGILKDGEPEDIRVWIDPLNETGGRGILPFAGLICADAYLWAVYREDTGLMNAFKRLTQNGTDNRRGYYGVIGHGAVIKHCDTIKDVRVGNAAYIKGANKLKNLTIKSDEQDPTQIGEGVELVNGIIGYGCHVFYGCKAVRFVLGNNCSLKYGARLIHSILGDNSTISCCEVLNNLVFPAHEQHHNNSFLIATMIMGQSNLAAGATVGSNHNSRGNDGEIIAGRGFWPGLSSTLKHNCRFASFTLISKGNYPAELNIPLPFSLLTTSPDNTQREVMPAYWWLYNMYALERNSWKFQNRDKRIFKVQTIETAYLAPDTVAEIIRARKLLEEWASEAGVSLNDENALLMVGPRVLERSPQPVKIIKMSRGYAAYREMLVYYAVKTLLEYFASGNSAETMGVEFLNFQTAHPDAVSFDWVNLGGQLIPDSKAAALRTAIREGELASWDAIHAEYEKFRREYPLDRALNALQVLRLLTGAGGTDTIIGTEQWNDFVAQSVKTRAYIEELVYKTKHNDYTDRFRAVTYRNDAERDAVLGRLEDNQFVRIAREDSERFYKLAMK
jgi:NDP-sugar pyrophosphorylase family protein